VPEPEDVEVTLDIAPITLVADKGQLSEVLNNLVTNAYEALGNQGSLRITATIQGHSALVIVEDNGPGIERSVAEHIFEPFYTTKHRGTGLGLAIVRRLVEAHGGSVFLENGIFQGTRFMLRLPFAGASRGGPLHWNSRDGVGLLEGSQDTTGMQDPESNAERSSETQSQAR